MGASGCVGRAALLRRPNLGDGAPSPYHIYGERQTGLPLVSRSYISRPKGRFSTIFAKKHGFRPIIAIFPSWEVISQCQEVIGQSWEVISHD
jgi:hypothetical protein